MADAPISDLVICDRGKGNDDFFPLIDTITNLDRSEFFYLPGKILHVDGDKSYLNRCMEFYKKSNVLAYGKSVKESEMPKEIPKFLKQFNPDILVITGHDAYFKKRENASYSFDGFYDYFVYHSGCGYLYGNFLLVFRRCGIQHSVFLYAARSHVFPVVK